MKYWNQYDEQYYIVTTEVRCDAFENRFSRFEATESVFFEWRAFDVHNGVRALDVHAEGRAVEVHDELFRRRLRLRRIVDYKYA